MNKTYKLSIDRAIASHNRHSETPIDTIEARQIHRLLSGRHNSSPSPETPMENPAEGPGVDSMTKERFIAGLARLGYNISTAHRLLGMGRSTIYRMADGTSEVPSVIMRLMDMYERFGIPNEHRGD